MNVDTLIVKSDYDGHTSGTEVVIDHLYEPVYTLAYDTNYLKQKLGKRTYELTDHRGNVYTTISDRKLAIDSNSEIFF